MQKDPYPNPRQSNCSDISIQEIPHSMKSFRNYTEVRKRLCVLLTENIILHVEIQEYLLY